DWIERHVRGEDAAELLAHHYLSALEYSQASGRDVTELGARARVALRDAGRRAVALNAFANAVRYFEAAVDLTPEADPDWARFAALGDENERAVTLGRQALALAEKLRHDELRAHLLNTIGVARTALGEKAGLTDLEASREIARGIGGPEYVRACGNLASVLTVHGQLQRSAELHREASQIA